MNATWFLRGSQALTQATGQLLQGENMQSKYVQLSMNCQKPQWEEKKLMNMHYLSQTKSFIDFNVFWLTDKLFSINEHIIRYMKRKQKIVEWKKIFVSVNPMNLLQKALCDQIMSVELKARRMAKHTVENGQTNN